MGDIKRFLAPAGVVVGSIVTFGSLMLDAASVAQWGLPFTAYAAAGFVVAIGSVLAIIYAHQREHEARTTLTPVSNPAPEPDASDETGGPQPSTVLPFNPYIDTQCKIQCVDLAGLWTEISPFIVVVVHVANCYSGSDVLSLTITGVDGTMRIGGLDCALQAKMVSPNPRVLAQRGSFYDCHIRQPLTTEMAQEMAGWGFSKINLWPEDARVLFDLSSMQWMGTIDSLDGSIQLPRRPVLDEPFLVLGPIRKEDSSKTVIKVQTTLISQEWWYDTGERHPPPESGT